MGVVHITQTWIYACVSQIVIFIILLEKGELSDFLMLSYCYLWFFSFFCVSAADSKRYEQRYGELHPEL